MMSINLNTNLSIGVKINLRVRDEKKMRVGFVEFLEGSAAESAMGSGTVTLDGKSVQMSYARKSSSAAQNGFRTKNGFSKTKLHVSGVPTAMTPEDICAMLGSCKITMPTNNKGYLFADFESQEEKNEAINKLNGKKIDEEHVLRLAPAYFKRPGFRKFKKDEKESE